MLKCGQQERQQIQQQQQQTNEYRRNNTRAPSLLNLRSNPLSGLDAVDHEESNTTPKAPWIPPFFFSLFHPSRRFSKLLEGSRRFSKVLESITPARLPSRLAGISSAVSSLCLRTVCDGLFFFASASPVSSAEERKRGSSSGEERKREEEREKLFSRRRVMAARWKYHFLSLFSNVAW